MSRYRSSRVQPMETISKSARQRNIKQQLRLVPELEPQTIEGQRDMDWWRACVHSGRLETKEQVSVLGVIHAHTNWLDGEAFPSINTISRLACIRKITAQRVIDRLQEL